MNKTQLNLLLNYLKMDKFNDEKPIDVKCAVCGSNKSKSIREKISWGKGKFGIFPIHCCTICGFIFQKKRFSNKFYNHYYSKVYREITLGNHKNPPKKYIQDQLYRGKKIYKFIKKYLPKKGKMVDIGSSVGLMMKPFLDNKWNCFGCDPIESYVNYGSKKYNLPVECIQSEDIKLKKSSIDLFLIMGSLEHVVDVNIVLKKVALAAKKESVLVLEARGDPLGNTKNFFNLNHHRYFLHNTLELIMIKYGFEPFLTTKYPISGESRPGTIFCLGRFKGKKISKNFKSIIKNGKRENFSDIFYKLKYYDYLSSKESSRSLATFEKKLGKHLKKN